MIILTETDYILPFNQNYVRIFIVLFDNFSREIFCTCSKTEEF